MRRLGIVAATCAALLAAPAGAVELADGKLTVSGFGEWGYGRTTNENAYLIGEEDGGYENAQFALALTARPQEDVVVAGQLFAARDGTFTLDWAFAEYRFDDLLRFRIGKVKNPLGIFMEVKDVGTLRPFFTLPQSIYGPGEFAAEAYQGVGATGEWNHESGWGVAYDAYAGALEVPKAEPAEVALAIPVPTPATPWKFSDLREEEEAKGVLGGRVTLVTPIDGLTARVSAFTGELSAEEGEAKERLAVIGVSAEYATERLQVRGEYFRGTEGDEETNLGGYAEVAWSFRRDLQVALRFDEAHQHVEGLRADSRFVGHHEAAVGLSYWPSPNLVFKASYHNVDGNRFAVPALSQDGTLDRTTHLFVAGAQFSF
jgi:hypothetical protein